MKLCLSLIGLCILFILLICVIFKIKKRNSLKYRLSKDLNHEFILAPDRCGCYLSGRYYSLSKDSNHKLIFAPSRCPNYDTLEDNLTISNSGYLDEKIK